MGEPLLRNGVRTIGTAKRTAMGELGEEPQWTQSTGQNRLASAHGFFAIGDLLPLLEPPYTGLRPVTSLSGFRRRQRDIPALTDQ
jgi:hypothetical protein